MMRRTLFATALLLLMTADRLYGLAPAASEASIAAETGDDSAYTEGTRALNEQRWQDAVAAFEKVAREKGKKTDAALYWKAYSLRKLGNTQAARATCDQLRAQFRSSRWNNDCAVLSLDVKIYAGSPAPNDFDPMVVIPPIPPVHVVVPPINISIPDMDGGRVRGSDEDLKLLAMNSLMNQEPTKAIPLLRGMLSGNQPPSVKKQALFVLTQSRSPEAAAALRDAVAGKMGPEVQREAIQSSGVFLGKRDNETLVEVYRRTSDAKIKSAVISALFISQDAPRLVELAKSEKDLEMKRRIVSQLALMQDKAATDYMMELLK